MAVNENTATADGIEGLAAGAVQESDTKMELQKYTASCQGCGVTDSPELIGPYVCGSCHNQFDTICALHSHIHAHGLGGSYYYDHKSKTAFPKHDSVCIETQTRRMVQSILYKEGNPHFEDFNDEPTTSFSIITDSKVDIRLSEAAHKFPKSLENEQIKAGNDGPFVLTEQSKEPTRLKRSRKRKVIKKYISGDKDETNDEAQINSRFEVDKNNKRCKAQKKVKSKCGRSSNSLLSWSSKTDDILKFSCFKCKLVFRSHRFLQIHIKKHNGIIQCDCCDSSFDSLEELQKHLDDEEVRDMKAMEILQCSYCDMVVTELRGLKAHLCVSTDTRLEQKQIWRKYNKNSAYNDKESETMPVTEEVITDAVPDNTDMMVQCKYCRSLFEDAYFLTKHSVVHKYVFKCSKCSLCFMTEMDRDLHFAECLNPSKKWKFECSTCGKKSPNRSTHTIHEEIHKSVKDNLCSMCGRGYKTKASVRDHMTRCPMLENRERKFSCELCGSKFFNKKVLKYHIESVHTETRPFVCEICANSFKTKILLKRHLRTHADRPTLSCDLCGAGFKEACALGRHRKLHLQQRKHSCEYCGKQFYEIWNLKAHARQHTGEKPYTCESCGRGFTHNVSRKTHMKNCTAGVQINPFQV